MKIHEDKFYCGKDANGEVIWGRGAKRNIDGQEIAKWFKEYSKIPAFGLVELPKFKSNAIARYVDTLTLKDGYLVCVYNIQPYGLIRNWIPVNSLQFQNTGRATRPSCISEVSLMKSIFKYRSGKNVEIEGKKAMKKFISNYYDMVNNGGSKKDFISLVFAQGFGVDLPENSSIEVINRICKDIYAQKCYSGEWNGAHDYDGEVLEPVFYYTY